LSRGSELILFSAYSVVFDRRTEKKNRELTWMLELQNPLEVLPLKKGNHLPTLPKRTWCDT
jgi:hypothetical protein